MGSYLATLDAHNHSSRYARFMSSVLATLDTHNRKLLQSVLTLR